MKAPAVRRIRTPADGCRTALLGAAGAAGAALATAAWHLGPAATWLPGLRRVISPALDGRGDPGHVALTFDDGPDPRTTPHFLGELELLGARATFFVLGSQLERYPELGRRIVAGGHELAVHGWHHERFWRPRPLADRRDLARTISAVERAYGRRPLWYRPPYGVLTATRLKAARTLGLQPVLWTAWGRDWTSHADAESVLRELDRRLCGGATVLLHDTDRSSVPGAWHSALEALPRLVMWCRADGLRVGPLAEHAVRGGRSARPRPA